MAVNENAYDRFRRQADVKDQCLKNKTSYFVGNHESTCVIHNERTDEDIVCTLVLNDNEGPDSAVVYIPIGADFEVADYFTWKNITFFAFEKVEIVKEVDFYKFKVLQCNVFVNDSFWAYFKSGLRAARDVSMGNKAETSTMIPLLVCPAQEGITFGSQLTFENQVWNIEDGDTYTLQGISYFYISRGINPRTDDDIEEEYAEMEIPAKQYYVGAYLTLPTEGGYYSTNLKTKLIERKLTTVTIQPLEPGNLVVSLRRNNTAVTYECTIKENA